MSLAYARWLFTWTEGGAQRIRKPLVARSKRSEKGEEEMRGRFRGKTEMGRKEGRGRCEGKEKGRGRERSGKCKINAIKARTFREVG